MFYGLKRVLTLIWWLTWGSGVWWVRTKMRLQTESAGKLFAVCFSVYSSSWALVGIRERPFLRRHRSCSVSSRLSVIVWVITCGSQFVADIINSDSLWLTSMLHGYDGCTHKATKEVLSNNIYLPIVLSRVSLSKVRCRENWCEIH